MKTVRFITLAIVLLMCSAASAHDFTVTINGQKVYFKIKSKKNKTAEVTYNGSAADKKPTYYEGELSIPATVQHDNTIYTVVGVSAKAFSGADKLTGIILPMGIRTIGNFAFEGCTELSKIVFPGNRVRFGEGVFFKCNKIKNVTFGSDWNAVDLKMFRWSDSLTTVFIPAKMEKVRNMKSLKCLKSIHVDVNNTTFASVDGVLYNKDKSVLYGCPRAFTGNLKVADSVKTVMRGAFIDCKSIKAICLPAGLESMSFREFSRMAIIEEIVFLSETPLTTAVSDGKGVLLLQVANPEVQISVPKKAQKAYKEALAQKAGEYVETGGAVPYIVDADELPSVKNISVIK